ncbi:MAG: D-alanyl-D-alanine carboxypeptidase [Lachnospiraceae bacterium]|nr:D-alanyl-D-alanine carboxypeptidase [Lachnospiraceae bacterium]
MRRRLFACFLILLLSAGLLAGAAEPPASEAPPSEAPSGSAPAETVPESPYVPMPTPAGILALPDLADVAEPPAVSAPHAVLYDMNSHTVLYAKDAYSRAYPASITKVMTALLTVEHCDLNDTVTFSYNATHNYDRESSSIARTEGEEMSVIDCLYGMMLASANEVAQGLAEHVSGSIRTFTALMNQRSRQLGAINTRFANPHGLHDDSHYTCCYDMALFMTEAMKHPELREIMGTYRYEIPPTNKHDEITYVRMTHPLLTGIYDMRYADAVAGKTGYTPNAGYTLVTYASRDDMNLVCVIMGASTPAYCGLDSTLLFEYGFNNFNTFDMKNYEESRTASGPLSGQMLALSSPEPVWVTLPKGMTPEVLASRTVYGGGEDQAASREYYLGRTLLARMPLVIGRVKELVPVDKTVSVAKTRREILRTPVLGLPVAYWAIGGIGLLCAAVLGLLIWFAVYTVRRLRRSKEDELAAIARKRRE